MGVFFDLTGQTFGQLTVLRRAESKSGCRKPYWECQCTCGNVSITQGQRLRDGDTKSCGQCQKGLNLTGQTFGQLTVLRQVASNRHHKFCWECQCTCGSVRTVQGAHLRSGATKSCGCLRSKPRGNDLTGHTFGRLTVLRQVESKGDRAFWECLCSCGNLKVVNAGAMRGGGTRSCGCIRKEVMKIVNAPKSKREVTDDALWHWYVDQKKSIVELAELYRVCPVSVRNWLKAAKIPLRSRKESRKIWEKNHPEQVRRETERIREVGRRQGAISAPYACEMAKRKGSPGIKKMIAIRIYLGNRLYTCQQCEKKFRAWKSKPRKFCTQECYHAYQRREKLPAWLTQAQRNAA